MNLTEWKQIMNLSGTAINIDDIPNEIDVAPVIRCKDCKHWYKGRNINYCRIFWGDDGELKLYKSNAEDYCSRAEREEE